MTEKEICPFCEKPIQDVDEAVWIRGRKRFYHPKCAGEVQHGAPSTGKLQSGSQKFKNRATRRGQESRIDSLNSHAGDPDPGADRPSR